MLTLCLYPPPISFLISGDFKMKMKRSFQVLATTSAAIACTFCITTAASAQSLITWGPGVNLFQGEGNESGVQ